MRELKRQILIWQRKKDPNDLAIAGFLALNISLKKKKKEEIKETIPKELVKEACEWIIANVNEFVVKNRYLHTYKNIGVYTMDYKIFSKAVSTITTFLGQVLPFDESVSFDNIDINVTEEHGLGLPESVNLSHKNPEVNKGEEEII